MKRNRERLLQEISIYTSKKENILNKKLKMQKDEIVLSNGLTNNSVLKIHTMIVEENIEPDIKLEDLRLEFKIGSLSNSPVGLNQKIIMRIDSSQLIESPFRIFLIHNNNSIFIDRFQIRSFMEEPYSYSFTYKGINFNIILVWIISKVNYYTKKIVKQDTKIGEAHDNINILNNCISHIEGNYNFIYKKITENFKNHIKIQLDEATVTNLNTDNKNNGKISIEKQIEISQKIEDYVLGMVGKDVIIMDKIVFFLNKIILPILVIIFLFRFDLMTVNY